MEFDVPRALRRGRWRHRDEDGWLASAHALLDLLTSSFGLADLSDTALLDMGCGTKLTKAILESRIPIGRYVGVDVSSDIIQFLTDSVHDSRFEFHHLDAHNDLYNPGGRPLDTFERLPVGEDLFGIISLFSVFTHLAPADYRAMLELLRPHVDPSGGLLFSVFIHQDEVDPALERAIERRVAAGDPDTLKAIEERLAAGAPAASEPPDFLDRIPERPLLEAVYSERYARELIEGTGWEVAALHPPRPAVIQHYFVCRPV